MIRLDSLYAGIIIVNSYWYIVLVGLYFKYNFQAKVQYLLARKFHERTIPEVRSFERIIGKYIISTKKPIHKRVKPSPIIETVRNLMYCRLYQLFLSPNVHILLSKKLLVAAKIKAITVLIYREYSSTTARI